MQDTQQVEAVEQNLAKGSTPVFAIPSPQDGVSTPPCLSMDLFYFSHILGLIPRTFRIEGVPCPEY